MIDLFSGIGGFSLAAKWAGIKTVQFVEKDKFCQKVLAKNFPNIPIYDDIKTFHYSGKVDLITGGFPCQPFSVAGKKQGVKDDRYLWPDMFRIIRECHPRWIIAENVPGIVPQLDPIIKNLETEDYAAWAYLVPACCIGAPHKRERLWIIANSNRERCDGGNHNRKKRHIQDNWQWYTSSLLEHWSKLLPQSWQTFDAQEWLSTSDANSIDVQKDAADINAKSVRSEREIINTENWENCISTNTFNEPSMQANTDIEKNTKAWEGYIRSNRPLESFAYWQEDQPPISGVDDGLPHIMDRNRSLGNAIVPQVIFPIMKFIYDLES